MKHTLILFSLLFSFIANGQSYKTTLAFPSLPAFFRAIDFQHLPDGSNRLVVIQQGGIVYLIDNSPTVSSRKVFLDLRSRANQGGGETGLLGLAFHPNFAQNGYFYINYTDTGKLTSVVSRLEASGDNHDTVLRSTEKILLQVDQPATNHNGGWIGFGTDGYLYTSFGDGGGAGDPWGNGQRKDTLLGKILRIDVNTGDPYSIPPSNPFVSGGGRKEIYAYGLRNAWRCSFDFVTNKLWAGDVGQNIYEEVDTIINGGNYGWDIKEGYHCFSTQSCDSTGMQSPIWEYPHSVGYSITGGYVYRGSLLSSLKGKYIYGDLNGKIFALTYEGKVLAENELLVNLGRAISSFGVDQNNELYIVSYGDTTSRIYKFVPEDGSVGSTAEVHLGSIYPNPASNVLHVKLADVVTAQITIADVTGKIVLTKDVTSDDASIDIAHLIPGVYTATISIEEKSQTTKFVIQR